MLEHAVAAIANDERGHLRWFVPAIVSSALGHDIGKIPTLYERKKKGQADHAEIAVELKRMVPVTINPEISKYVENAVYFHHTNMVDTSPAQVVMEADAGRGSRRYRTCTRLHAGKTDRRVARLRPVRGGPVPRINEKRVGNVWKAMSFNGIVIACPTFASTV